MTALVILLALAVAPAVDVSAPSVGERQTEVDGESELGAEAEPDAETEPDAESELDSETEPDAEAEADAPEEPAADVAPEVTNTATPTAADQTTNEDHTVETAEAVETVDADEKAKNEKKTKKKLEWSIGSRIMGGWEVERERPVDMPAQTQQEPFLRQARIKVRIDYTKRFKIRASVELADALRAPDFERVSYLRNAYGLVRFHDAARLQFGYFKRPFSRLELRSPGDLPVRGRGLANGRIVEDRNYGDRSVGTMMWGKIAAARLSWFAGAFAPALRRKGVDAIGRVQADPLKWLSLGTSGGYKHIDNGIGERVNVGSFGADLRVKIEGLYFLADLVMGQDYLVPGEPFALGVVGYASYDVDLPKKLVLQPVALVEWADANIEVSQNDAIRSVLGVNLLWRKRFRVMPQVELIRPRGVIANPWTNRDTYYVMLSLEL